VSGSRRGGGKESGPVALGPEEGGGGGGGRGSESRSFEARTREEAVEPAWRGKRPDRKSPRAGGRTRRSDGGKGERRESSEEEVEGQQVQTTYGFRWGHTTGSRGGCSTIGTTRTRWGRTGRSANYFDDQLGVRRGGRPRSSGRGTDCGSDRTGAGPRIVSRAARGEADRLTGTELAKINPQPKVSQTSRRSSSRGELDEA